MDDINAMVLRDHGVSLAEALVTRLVVQCHGDAARAGWWTDIKTGADLRDADGDGGRRFNVAEKLALIHSEVSEALEADRKGLMDDHLPHRKGIEVELADAMIRICDLAGALSLDLGGAVAEKLAYNRLRADHKLHNRAAAGGKKY
jgi:hypothetical protein